MSRGFLVGLLWGVLVSAAGLVVVSLVAPPMPTEVATGEGAGSEVAAEVAAAPAAQDPAEPLAKPEDLAKPEEKALATAAEPSVGTVTLDQGQTLADDPAETTSVSAGETAPAPDLAANGQESAATAAATQAAAAEPAPSVDARAADTLATAETGDNAAIAAVAEPAPTLPEGEPLGVTAPAADAAPAPDSGTMPAPRQDKLLDPPSQTETPGAETAPELPQGEAAGEMALPQVPAQPAAPTDPEPAVDPQTNPQPPAEESGSKLVPDAALDKDVAGVVSNRLPRIGDTDQNAADPATTGTALALDPADALPIVAHARDFTAEAGKPRFAILLQDIGAQGMARDDLVKLPFALTFVIDPTAPDAAQAAAAYRAAGQEVMILAKGLPEGATAADLEQSFQALAAELPQTVAMLDAASGGLQENRPLATQAIPILKSQGRGIVTYDRGLGAADQVAAREGLPHAAIFRELDAEGEDTPLIRRYLDRAAFKAAQEGAVVVIGQTRPETVAAILEWMVEGRGASVQLAPITAVMQAE